MYRNIDGLVQRVPYTPRPVSPSLTSYVRMVYLLQLITCMDTLLTKVHGLVRFPYFFPNVLFYHRIDQWTLLPQIIKTKLSTNVTHWSRRMTSGPNIASIIYSLRGGSRSSSRLSFVSRPLANGEGRGRGQIQGADANPLSYSLSGLSRVDRAMLPRSGA